MKQSPHWIEDCLRWNGKVLEGKFSHWCYDWDELPIDETCCEFGSCSCEFEKDNEEANVFKKKWADELDKMNESKTIEEIWSK